MAENTEVAALDKVLRYAGGEAEVLVGQELKSILEEIAG